MPSADAIRALHREWDLDPHLELAPLRGGINSSTWLVTAEGQRFVAKAAHRSQLVPGVIVAAAIERRGIAAGAPLPTTRGELVVTIEDDSALALLRYVPGRPLDPNDDADVARLGTTLGTVHRALLEVVPPANVPTWPWRWLSDFERLPVGPRLRAAVEGAMRDAEGLVGDGNFTLSVLHGDVSPSDFLFDETTGSVGLIDWGATVFGPLLYDIGSLCGLRLQDERRRRIFLSAYVAAGPIGRDELAHLETFIRLRWAVQARYFSWRIRKHVRTGIDTDRANRAGLVAALDGLSVRRPTGR